MKRENIFKTLLDYGMLVVGALLMALALNLFLAPNIIAPGGVTGFAVIVAETLKLPIYLTNLAINIPLFIFGARLLGRVSASRTFFTTLVFTIILKYLPIKAVTGDLLLAGVFGGLITGLGLGLVFKFGGTTGGTDLAGEILNKLFPRLKISSFMMLIDSLVVLLAGLVERRPEITLYSIIALYSSVKIVDMILEGPGYLKAFYIITYETDRVADQLMRQLNRGVTSLKGRGMYTKEERDVLLCAVNRSEFTRVKDLVHTIDPRAFIMVTDMVEIWGEGFSYNIENSWPIKKGDSPK